MKLLIITEVFYPEEFLINEVVKEWTAKGHEIEILTRNPSYPYGKVFDKYKNKLYSVDSSLNAKVHRYHIIQGYKKNSFRKIANYLWNGVLATKIAILKLRKNNNIFVYHTGPLTVAIPAVLLKKLTGAKVTIWTQDIWPDTIFAYGIKPGKFRIKLINWFVKWIYSNCDNIIVSSPGFKKRLQQYTEQEISVIPNWPHSMFVQHVPETDNHPSEIFSFAFAGNIGRIQNLHQVIPAFHEWSKNRPDVVFNIFGDGSGWEELKEIIKAKDIRNVILHGRVAQKEMPSIYAKSDALVISLSADPIFDLYIPAKFSTYLTANKPIVAIMNGEVSELIQEYQIGSFANPDDREAMQDAFASCFELSATDKAAITKQTKLLYKEYFHREASLTALEKIVLSK